MQNLLHSKRVHAIMTVFVMTVLLVNPYLQISFSTNGYAEATNNTCTPHVADFNERSAGDILTSGEGYSISVDSNGDHDTLMVFDTLDPTGGDNDLTTKDGDRYGPGNTQERGNALIISEDGDTNDPDDEKDGGVITITLTEPLTMKSMGFLDIEESGGSVKVYDDSDSLLKTSSILDKGDNSYQSVSINTENVSKVVISLVGSGAIPEIKFCVPEEPEYCELTVTKSDDGYNPTAPGEDIVYHLHLENIGTDKCTGGGVKLRDKYPSDQIEYVTHTLGDDYDFEGSQFTHSGDELTWNFGTVYPADEDQWEGKRDVYVTFTVKDSVQCTEVITNKVKTYSAEEGWSEYITEDTSLECTPDPICGDGVVDDGEQCDDGNRINGDGCSNQCLIDSPVCTDQVMYAIHDAGIDDTNLFSVRLNTGATTAVGPERDNYDIEAIDIHPTTGVIYGLSGDSSDSASYKKLLTIDPVTGVPDMSTGVQLDIAKGEEYKGASFHPVTGELWASGEDIELVTVNLTTGNKTVKKNVSGDPEALAWNNEGTALYVLYQNDRLDMYDPTNNSISNVCSDMGDIEGMEFDLNNNLIIGYHDSSGLNIDIFDPATCSAVQSSTYDVNYSDIETMTFACYEEPQVGAIAGCKYEDANNNGVIDSGEQTLPGWTITLSENGSQIASTVTGNDGCYIFEDLPLGTYEVAEQQEAGWVQTYPSTGTHTISLTSAQTIGAVDFANFEEPVNNTYCGDGFVQMPNDNGEMEQCDDGVNNGIACTPDYGSSCSYCSVTCEPIVVDGPYCGDGILDDTEGEQCDDGNNEDGDGCSAQCTIETYTCELDLSKVVDKSTAELGDDLVYTIQLENIGDGECTDVVLTDTFPNGIGVVDSTPAPTSGANVWEVGTMQPGDIYTISVDATIEDDNNLCDQTITNSVVYTSNETGEGDPATADTTIECEPPSGECRLELEKTDVTDPVSPGSDLEYILTLTNVGDASCTNVLLEEDYDDNTTFISSTPSPDMTDTWVVGSLLPNESFSVNITVAVDDNEQLCEAQLINTAYHDSSQTTRASVSETTDVICEQEPVYDVYLEKTVSSNSVELNGQVTFTITVGNEGTEDLTGVEVTDYLPSELQYDTYAVSTGTFDEQALVWTVGDLTPGQTETLNITVTVVEEGSFTNKAEVTAHQEIDVDSTPNNGTENDEDDTAPATVSAEGGGGGGGCVSGCGGGGPVYPQIVIEKSAAVTFTNPDTVVGYTITVTNNGNATGLDLVVTDVLPSPLTYVSSTVTGVWNLGDITVGETKTLTYDVEYPENVAVGTYTNVATAEISNGNSDTDDAVVEVRDTTVFGEEYEPILSIVKVVDRAFTNPGGVAVYTVTVTNVTTNNETAKNVILSDRMPEVFSFDNGANVKGFELGDLAPGESKTVSYTIDVSTDATNGTYDNIASARADNAPTVYATVPIEIREIIIEGFVLPDTNGSESLFLSMTAGGLLILLAWMIKKYRELTLIELA
ncbi:MAG: SdrD B-like domain-containing protein [Patescibacteria group bacterium]